MFAFLFEGKNFSRKFVIITKKRIDFFRNNFLLLQKLMFHSELSIYMRIFIFVFESFGDFLKPRINL